MTRKLGFNEVWIFWILMVVTTVSYLVLVNGQPTPIIKPTRRIHQGDPISPYLYLIYAGGLSTLINEVKKVNKIRGVKVAKAILLFYYY